MLCKHLSPVISFGACFLSCYWESGRSHRSREAAEKEEVGLRYSRPGLVVSTHSLAFAVYREKVCLAKDEDGERTWSGSRHGSLKPERMNRQGRLRAELLQANDTLGAHQGILLRQRGSREFCCIHFLFFFFFLQSHLQQHLEVPRLGIKLKLHLLPYATATATPNSSRICGLRCILQHR